MDQNGQLEANIDQIEPFWSIEKIQFGIRPFDQNGPNGPVHFPTVPRPLPTFSPAEDCKSLRSEVGAIATLLFGHLGS